MKNLLVIPICLCCQFVYGQLPLYTNGSNYMTEALNIQREGYSSIELNSNTGSFIDFHTTISSDFDGRIIWNYNNSGIFNIHGNTNFKNDVSIDENLSIGTFTPLTKLHVVDNFNGEVIRVESSTNASQIKLSATGDGGQDWSIMSTANGASLGGGKFSIYGNAEHRFVLDNNGKVGIGTTAPEAHLHLKATGWAYGKIEGGSNSSAILELSNTSMTWQVQTDQTDNFVLRDKTNNAKRLVINPAGNVGIGTISPNYKLDVDGTGKFSGTLSLAPLSSGGLNFGHDWKSYASSETTFYISKSGTSGAEFEINVDDNVELSEVLMRGKVGIGTSTFGSHRLAVHGSIGARAIKVEANGWSDFVFEDDYELKSLEEVEQHINDNGHLPEIPSEVEVIENGINLGEMDSKLLQKIEELTLYLIEQNKQLERANQNIAELQKKVSILEKD